MKNEIAETAVEVAEQAVETTKSWTSIFGKKTLIVAGLILAAGTAAVVVKMVKDKQAEADAEEAAEVAEDIVKMVKEEAAKAPRGHSKISS